MHDETTVTTTARPLAPFADRRRGIPADHPDYGVVQVIRRTKVEHVTDGRRRDVRGETVTEEVLIDRLDSDEAALLIRTLASALAASLHVGTEA